VAGQSRLDEPSPCWTRSASSSTTFLARIPAHHRDVIELSASAAARVGFNPLDVTVRDPDVVVDGIMAAFEAFFSDGWATQPPDISPPACARSARAKARIQRAPRT